MKSIVSKGVVTGVVVLTLAIAIAVFVGLEHAQSSSADPFSDYPPFVPCQGSFPGEGEYQPCYSLRLMKQKAHAVIEGTVVSSEQRDIDIGGGAEGPDRADVMPHWVSSVRVDRVIKGSLSVGDVVEVRQLIIGDAIWMGRKNDRGVLLLTIDSSGSYAWPFNPVQAVVPYMHGFAFLGQYDEVSPRDTLTEDEFVRLVQSLD